MIYLNLIKEPNNNLIEVQFQKTRRRLELSAICKNCSTIKSCTRRVTLCIYDFTVLQLIERGLSYASRKITTFYIRYIYSKLIEELDTIICACMPHISFDSRHAYRERSNIPVIMFTPQIKYHWNQCYDYI